MIYTIYSKITGKITKLLSCTEEDLFLNYDQANESYLEGEIEGTKYYIDLATQQPVGIPIKLNNWSTFDFVTKEWVGDEVQANKELLDKRNSLLYKSDWTQLPRTPLTPEKQDEWEVYRQALRDVTQQSGYPFNVVWPVKPM